MNEVPNNVSTGSRNIDEAGAPQEKREIPLPCQFERTGDPSPPSNVKSHPARQLRGLARGKDHTIGSQLI